MELIKSFIHVHRAKIGLIGLIFVALLSLFVFFNTSKDLYKYLALNSSSEAFIDEVNIKQIASNEFVLQVNFFYFVNEQKFKAHSLVDNYTFPNEFAAQDYAKSFKTKSHIAWYKIEDQTSFIIDKTFPYKSVINSLVLIIVFTYFIGISRYLKWKKT
jgi:hypothetical protein